MTETEKKALALVNEVMAEYPLVGYEMAAKMALCRAIEQHEAFRQEVSDAMKLLSEEHEAFRQEVSDAVGWWNMEYLLGDDLRKEMARFIIAKPDPLVEIWNQMIETGKFGPDELRNAMKDRGYEWTKTSESNNES